MGKSGRPGPTLDDYLYWQERLESRGASGLGMDEFCIDEGVSRSTFYRWVRRLREGYTGFGQRGRRSFHIGRLGGGEVFARVPDGISARDRVAQWRLGEGFRRSGRKPCW